LTGNNDDDIEALKAFQTRWAEIGFVPIKEKETVQNEFRKLINDHFDQLDIDEFEKNIERFKSKINTFDNSDDKDSKIKRKISQQDQATGNRPSRLGKQYWILLQIK